MTCRDQPRNEVPPQCPGRSRDENSHDLSFRVVLSLKDKAPPEPVTFFNEFGRQTIGPRDTAGEPVPPPFARYKFAISLAVPGVTASRPGFSTGAKDRPKVRRWRWSWPRGGTEEVS